MNIEKVNAVVEYYDETISNDILTITSTAGSTFNNSVSAVDRVFNINWKSAEISDENAKINTYLEITFSKIHSMAGFAFTGNITINHFRVYCYKNDEIVASGSTYYEYGWIAASNFNKIRIEIVDTQSGNEYAEIENIAFYFKKAELGENSIYSVSMRKSFDITAESDSDGECQFAFRNDFFTPYGDKEISTISDTLKQNQKVAMSVKYINKSADSTFGFYKTKEIYGEDRDEVINVNAVDALVAASETFYKNGKVYPNGRTLYDWAQEILADAGLKGIIDEELKNIVSKGYITEVPHREALRLIAEASGGVLFVDNNGKVNIKILSYKSGGLGTETNAESDIVDGTLSITNPEKIQGITVPYYAYIPQEYSCELGYIESMVLTDTPQKVDITYAQFPVATESVAVYLLNSIAEITEQNVYSDRIEIFVKAKAGKEGERTFITVTGKPYDTTISEIKTSEATQNIKNIENNYLITDLSMAQNIADYQSKMLVNNYKYSFEIANPNKNFELGEQVLLKRQLASGIKSNTLIITGIGVDISFENETVTYTGVEVEV